MHQQLTDAVDEVKRLQRCMNDLVSVLALPAVWSGSEPGRILDISLDALVAMLDLDFFYARVRAGAQELQTEVLKTARSDAMKSSWEEIRRALNEWPGDAPQRWSGDPFRHSGEQAVSVFPIRLGIDGELGLIVAGSRRPDFPTQTESLVLGVAANQLAIGLQQALSMIQQKQVASELDWRVAERTRELAEANRELQLQVGLLQHLPVSAWILEPDGTPDYVNQVWLEFSGQTLEFVRSRPDAWLSVVHPEDREAASMMFWKGVRSGQGFSFETRSLYARDGSYRWHLQQAVVLRDADGKVLKFVGTTTDIDDQKRAQEAMRTSEANLRRVIDTIPTLSWCNLADGPNEFLSKSWHDYTGLSPEEAHGWGWSAAFHLDDLAPLMTRWQELLIAGESGEIEARLRRYDGVYRWFLIRVAPFFDDAGRILRWYGTSTDIHDRKLADEALRASEDNLRRIVDSVPGLVCTMDASGEIEQLNKPLMEYFGKTAEDLKNWKMTDAVHPDDLPDVIKAYTYSVTTGTPYEIEHRCRRADGVYRWFQVRALAVKDGEDHVTGWYVLLTDIDDRKRAEEALLTNERDLGLIINTMPVLAWSALPDGNADFFNQRWLNYTGLTQLDAHGWGWAIAFHPDDLYHVNDYWRSRILSGEPGETEARLRRFDGSYRWFLLRANPLRDQSGAIVKWYGTNTDIDDRKRAEDELRNTQEELAKIARITTMGELTASIAHEVNQPLSGIITNANTCLRMLDASPPNIEGARETARRTLRDGNRASDVITRLRTLFNRKEVVAESVDLNEATREVVTLILSELHKNSVILAHEYASQLPILKGDRIQLQQVILNLIRNALDAMAGDTDGPKRLILRTEQVGDHVRLTVQDSGVGFDPSAAERMFESFYTTKPDGMGIGLSVCRSIIEAHHGRLWATANEGDGATFAFAIPWKQSD